MSGLCQWQNHNLVDFDRNMIMHITVSPDRIQCVTHGAFGRSIRAVKDRVGDCFENSNRTTTNKSTFLSVLRGGVFPTR